MIDESSDSLPAQAHAGDARSRWREERTTFQRVYDVMTGVTDYATAGDVADRAACSDDGARDAFAQLIEMGIVEKREGRPAEYRRNESYFRWKRLEELAKENSPATLQSQIEELIEEDEAFQERFGAPGPDSISPAEFEATDHDTIHDRWEALTRWRSIRHDIEILREAAYRAERREGTCW